MRLVECISEIGPAYEEAALWAGPYLVLVGGSTSGKSTFWAQKHIARCMKTPGERFLLIRKVYRTCRWSVYQQVKDVMARGGFERAAEWRDSTADIFFRNGSAMLTVGMDNLDKIKSISGISSAVMDEGSEFDEADFNEIDRRLRGEPLTYHQLTVATNPLPGGRWIKDLFIDNEYPGAYVKQTTVLDNPWATDRDREKLERTRDETERKIYLLGEWASHIEGVIYPQRSESNPRGWITGPYPEDADSELGVDFGFENPAAVVRTCIRDVPDGPFLHVDEMVYEAGLTNPQLADRMRESGYAGEVAWCDASEPKSVKELKDAGIKAKPVDKGPGSVAAGLKKVQEYILVISPRSVNIRREIEMYRRQPDTTRYAQEGTFLEDPIKKNDHAMDAMRYPVFMHRKRPTRLISRKRSAA